ncbi:D-beta-hydroxybutyrate dehydrogenase, mitochondrial-like [Centruroides sculpturatus]|uniref:D-beta-hydroxybutyrate dehydrogenase, mitochondrial-like n=1 Tax=Centruroides sculpturatus TaxID=218467 RepID=UPI000C6CD26C|nr:D-beta-hydroxybutyrate dehydrogenase, mitochondrial-like [Centruroides sculpturatus]
MEDCSYYCILGVIIFITFLYLKLAKATFNFEKCVFISGCDSGLGHKMAIYLHSLGCTVFAGCLFPDGNGANLLKQQKSERLKIVPLDITNEESVKNALECVKNEWNQKSLVLINNAGVCIYGEFDWLSWRQCCYQLDINLYGTIRMTKMFLPLIRKHKGRIINITSINGKIAYPGISVYCATKYALEGFSDVLRYELDKFGVKVIVIEPGDFARVTNIMANHSQHSEEMWEKMDDESKKLYQGYFQKYHDITLKNFGIGSPKNIESSSMLETIKEAVFGDSPSPRYVVSSATSKFIYKLLQILPTTWNDALFRLIMNKALHLQVESN